MSKDKTAGTILRELLDELEAAKTTRWQTDGPVTAPDLTDIARQIDRILAEVAGMRDDIKKHDELLQALLEEMRATRSRVSPL
jgi:hypothetical protein